MIVIVKSEVNNLDWINEVCDILVPRRERRITQGKSYTIHALAVLNTSGVRELAGPTVTYLIVDDDNYPRWYPAQFFTLHDKSVPIGWQFLLNDISGESWLVMAIGPTFIVQDEQSYRSMVELHPRQVSKFWDHVNNLGNKVQEKL